MPAQHTNAAKITGPENPGGRDDTCEGDGLASVKRKPPVPLVKYWNRRTIKKGQLMKLAERICDILIRRFNFAYPIHPRHPNFSSLSAPLANLVICRASP